MQKAHVDSLRKTRWLMCMEEVVVHTFNSTSTTKTPPTTITMT